VPRVKRGTKRRANRRKTLGLAKGFFLTKSKLHRAAQEAVEKSLKYGYVGRRLKKRDFRCASEPPAAPRTSPTAASWTG
jgi:large subunit ribosomal protein L20